MTLTERIQAHTCAVVACKEARVTGSLVCAEHLNEMFANRLDRTPEGTFVQRDYRRFPAKDLTGHAA